MGKYKAIVTYTFKAEYSFDGPKTLVEATEWAEKHVEMTTAGLTTSLPDEQCDWNVNVHGKKSVIRVTKDK